MCELEAEKSTELVLNDNKHLTEHRICNQHVLLLSHLLVNARKKK